MISSKIKILLVLCLLVWAVGKIPETQKSLAADGDLAPITPSMVNLTKGSTTSLTITFTLSHSLDQGEKIKITFPSGFGVSNATAHSDYCNFGSGGTYTVGMISGQVVPLTRGMNGSLLPIGTVMTCKINIIVNPSTAGVTGTFGVQISDATEAVWSVTDNAGGTVTIAEPTGLLTSCNIAPESLVAGYTGKISVMFTINTSVPTNGKIVMILPSGYTISSGATTAVDPALSGCYSDTCYVGITIDGQTITLTGDSAGYGIIADATIWLNNIRNPQVSGSTGTYTINTKKNDNTQLDTCTPGASTITAGALSSTNVEPATLVQSATGTATVTFTTSNPVPANGKVVVIFPSGFSISSPTGTCTSTMDGTFSASFASTTVTITRQNDGTSEPVGAQTCTITNVTNPSTTGSTGTYTIRTTNTSDVKIDENASVAADTITAAGGASPVVNTLVITATSGDGTNDTSISLIENTTKSMYIEGTFTDADGCSSVSFAQVSLYRTTVSGTQDCSASNSNCYQVANEATDVTITNCSGGADTTGSFSTTIPIQYYADPTDAGTHSATNWTAYVRISDGTNTATSTITSEMESLLSLNATATIAFGSLALSATSSQQTAVITNTGNKIMDVRISANADMTCTNGTVPIGNSKYSLTNGFTYGTGTGLSTSAVTLDLNIAVSTGNPSTSPIYFLLQMPSSGVGGNCSNTITFTAQ